MRSRKTQSRKTLDYLQALLLGLLSVGLMGLMLDANHNWGGDFSQYIAQARAIVEGAIPKQIADNSFIITHSGDGLGPKVYPWGFPVLLAPVYALFGFDLIALKWVNITFYGGFIALLFLYARERLPKKGAVLATLCFALNPYLLFFSANNVVSDVSYLFFCLAGVWCLEKLFAYRGDSSLGNHSQDFGNFGAVITREVTPTPKSPKNLQSNTANTRIVEEDTRAESKGEAESNPILNSCPPEYSKIVDGICGLQEEAQGSYLSGNDRRHTEAITDLSRKAESSPKETTRQAKSTQPNTHKEQA